MKIIYWHHKDQPYIKCVAIENAEGYFNCEMPYMEFADDDKEREDPEIRTLTHWISQQSFDRMAANGTWIIDQTVTYNTEAK